MSITAYTTRKRKIKHPFLIVFIALLVLLFVYLCRLPKLEEKKLDYSKPIFTAGSTIVCPESILLDPEADHEIASILRVFGALTGREEKARAIGCTAWREGIYVKAHRMAAPFDAFVAISTGPGENESLFTMEGDLMNADTNSAIDVDPTPTGQTPEEKAEAAAVRAQELIAANSPNAATAARLSYDADRVEFQRRLPTLEEPAPNLRWYPSEQRDSDEGEVADLVTPYGPCVIMMKGDDGEYRLLFGDMNPYLPPSRSTQAGTYSSRDQANQAAVKRCNDWYSQVIQQPENSIREQHRWFKPDQLSPTSNGGQPLQPAQSATVAEARASVLGQSQPALIERRDPGSSSRDNAPQQTAIAHPGPDESICAGYLDSGGDGMVLSNGQGVNFKPYIQKIMQKIYDEFHSSLPPETLAPLNKQGDTRIRFSIASDGTLLAMHIDGTPGNDILGPTAWSAIRDQQFSPLPAEFHGPCLTVRMRFVVNK